MSVHVLIDAIEGRPSGEDRRVIAFATDLAKRFGSGRPVLCLWQDGDREAYGETGCELLAFQWNGSDCERAAIAATLSLQHYPRPSCVVAARDSYRAQDALRQLAVRWQAASLGHDDISSLNTLPQDRISALVNISACPQPASTTATRPGTLHHGNGTIEPHCPQVRARRYACPRGMALEAASRIISAGRGISDWEAFHALADRLDATIGATRSICDRGDLPRDRQVGTSGSFVASDLYLALGISGAPQHLQGMSGCQHVIAVNTDPYAPIMSRADLAIVGDVQHVMPALIAALDEAAPRELPA